MGVFGLCVCLVCVCVFAYCLRLGFIRSFCPPAARDGIVPIVAPIRGFQRDRDFTIPAATEVECRCGWIVAFTHTRTQNSAHANTCINNSRLLKSSHSGRTIYSIVAFSEP